MELDKRIKSLSDILTCFDIERAEQFIGQKGYFADGLSCYHNLANRTYDTLTHIKDGDYPFKEGKNNHWRYFIPECSLKPKEKQYRAYTIGEFEREFTIGNIVTFRHKTNRNSEYRAIYNGYHINSEGEFMAYLGIWKYSLEELFDYYELLNSATAKWQPFGVEE